MVVRIGQAVRIVWERKRNGSKYETASEADQGALVLLPNCRISRERELRIVRKSRIEPKGHPNHDG